MNREYKLPEILYKLLAEHHMTQQQLADKLVCGQNTIYKWLRKDIMPNLCFIMRMSEIFNVSTDYLIYGTESRWIWQIMKLLNGFWMIQKISPKTLAIPKDGRDSKGCINVSMKYILNHHIANCLRDCSARFMKRQRYII